MTDLDRWLQDIIRQGLAELPSKPYSFWDQAAARLVDAQALGLANQVRSLAGIPYQQGEKWPERMLRALGQIHLLVQGYWNIEALEPLMQAEVRSLQTLNPDIILIEGPPEATDTLSLLASEGMQPPVALLLYPPENLQLAAYYPFAVFFPEWQAIQYGLKQDISVRFMDLPQTHQMAERIAQQEEDSAVEESLEKTLLSAESTAVELPSDQQIILDPLAWLAQSAGYTDSERWWEHLVEQRQDDSDLFDAILEAMTALRQEIEQVRPDSTDADRLREAQREAHMRQTIRKAQKEGFQRIAVVCGAWHSPALSEPFPAQKEDSVMLKGLPKVKVKATWIPWTYARLSRQSGYGAGIDSPGWYEHLWKTSRLKTSQSAIRWLTRVARLLRKEDLEASSANVIEAVRLAEALAAMRDAAMPGLDELTEATRTVLCFGDETPLKLIHQKLIVCDRLGKVPAETPLVPLQQDLQQLQKQLRLKPEVEEKLLTLDLRKDRDLARSHLLNRLSLLNIHWGKPQRTSGKGTFKEVWKLRWQPDLSLAIIEAGRWGNTVSAAASASVVAEVLDGLVARICIGLPVACASLDDEAVAKMLAAIEETHSAIRLVQNKSYAKTWSAALYRTKACEVDREGVS